MRRRSERKKSTDISNSPAPAASRRSSRRSRVSESEKTEENAEIPNDAEDDADSSLNARASSEEPLMEKTSRRGRGASKRTLAKERGSPAKRKNQRGGASSPELKIDSIPEEENGSDAKEENPVIGDHENTTLKGFDDDDEATEVKEAAKDDSPANNNVNVGTDDSVRQETIEDNDGGSIAHKVNSNSSISPKMDEKLKGLDVLELQDESQEGKSVEDDAPKSDSPVISQENAETNDNDIVRENNAEDQESRDQMEKSPVIMMTEESREVQDLEDSALNDGDNRNQQTEDNADTQSNSNGVDATDKSDPNEQKEKLPQLDKVNERIRKRKWITKKTNENKPPVLSISTDSLKNLIADVHPVPLSDVHLESSSEVEEVTSEREEGEKTPSPDRSDRRRSSLDKLGEKPIIRRVIKEPATATVPPKTSEPVQRSPSPPRNQSSCVLYITNLVRPFTVLQLKGLLARTGKIVEDGFWIDRIKSRCYVEYETEDEAIETRHALHGVRWPVSNPKCLNVDFGRKEDMQKMIESTKDEAPKLGVDNKDNFIVGTGWSRQEDLKKSARPVREWDVGKKDSLERDVKRDKERERRHSSRERERNSSRERENERSDRRGRIRDNNDRSKSASPVRKIQKKENQPPLRLLDDLFRKTKTTPCIYWLPLTPEQIAEKEAFRQKRIAEHKERVKARELEREKERERERERERNRRRSTERDRRRSRSRDRRRY